MMCEDCKKEFAMVCLNGVLWLCWDCYCKKMAKVINRKGIS
jgi:hypothetical protein